MKIIIELKLPHFRNPLTIPTYFKKYYGLKQPQWENPDKKIGVLDVIRLWWAIE